MIAARFGRGTVSSPPRMLKAARTFASTVVLPVVLGLCLHGFAPSNASAQKSGQDADLCFLTAERVDDGETLSDTEKEQGHEACVRALSTTASIVQKYQFQEAAFTILGTRNN